MWQIISGYIGVIIMMAGVYIFGRIVLESKVNLKNTLKDLMWLLIFSIPQTLIFLHLSGVEKSVLMSIVNILFYKLIFKIENKKSVFLILLYMMLLVIVDLIELFVVTKILKISMEYCYNSFAGSILSNLFVCILFSLTTVILRKQLRKTIEKKVENNTKIIIFSIMTFFCILLFFYTIIKEFRFRNDIFLYLFAIIVLIGVLFSLIRQTMINNKITNDYDKLLEFMKTYEEEIENQRTLRHETKNEFLAIRSKICDKEKEKTIIDYIDEILGDTYLVKNEKYAKFGYLPANGVKGLCYFKTQKAEEQGISVSINISKKIQSSTICNLNTKEQRDFAKILGVFIDNAIEASAESKDKELGIEAYSNLDNEFRMIISNTYNNEIDEEKIGKENFTTKGKNRGHGLLLVNQLVKKNNIFDTKREIKNNIYSQTIIVKNRQK